MIGAKLFQMLSNYCDGNYLFLVPISHLVCVGACVSVHVSGHKDIDHQSSDYTQLWSHCCTILLLAICKQESEQAAKSSSELNKVIEGYFRIYKQSFLIYIFPEMSLDMLY